MHHVKGIASSQRRAEHSGSILHPVRPKLNGQTNESFEKSQNSQRHLWIPVQLGATLFLWPAAASLCLLAALLLQAGESKAGTAHHHRQPKAGLT